MKSYSGIYRAQNLRYYVAALGSMLREASLRSGIENYTMAYQKVWSRLRSGVELYAVAYPKLDTKKILFLRRGVPKSMVLVFLLFKTRIWPSRTVMNMYIP